MNISQLVFDKLSDLEITNLLFTDIDDDCEYGDCILVVGSKTAVNYRLPKAIDLYNQGRAGKILFSGGGKHDGSDITEAVLLKNKAIALGIPEKDILIETLSLNP
ncbi:YdcF family protein [Bacillus salitolerans]|uniref:YdcF family protein n=1 Tax=Bacillus salitolerans TaxID=1437434 RepID=A0ABW4LPA8_9BACI